MSDPKEANPMLGDGVPNAAKPKPIDSMAISRSALISTVIAVLNQPQMTKGDKLMVLEAVVTHLEGEA